MANGCSSSIRKLLSSGKGTRSDSCARTAKFGTLEWSCTLIDRGGWYCQSIGDLTEKSGDAYVLLDVWAKDVGFLGVFSNWPAAVTYYASCMKLR